MQLVFRRLIMATYPIEESRNFMEENLTPLVDNPPAEPEVSEAPRCAHYWVIEPANGPMSRGVCQVCWEVRDFSNTVENPDSFIA